MDFDPYEPNASSARKAQENSGGESEGPEYAEILDDQYADIDDEHSFAGYQSVRSLDENPYEYQPQRAQPRFWSPLLIVVVSCISWLSVSAVAGVFAVMLVKGNFTPAMLADPETMKDVMKSRLGLFIVVVVPQFALVLPSIFAAFVSPVETRQRLGLVRGHWPVWAWLGAAFAAPLLNMVFAIFLGLFLEESESLKEMSETFRQHGQSGFLIPIALMIGVTPAICEELLFRGYVQTRLNRAIGPAIGILITSVLFSVFHIDFVHALGVFPLGVFLGFLAWRSGSIFPAMIAHFVNNALSVFAVVLGPEAGATTVSPVAAVAILGVIAFGIMGMTSTAIAFFLYGPPPGTDG